MAHTRSLMPSLIALSTFVWISGGQAQEKLRTWSGFVFKGPDLSQPTPPTTFTYIRARWTQPSVDCTTPSARVSFWVGLDGDGTPTVEQVGTVAVCGDTATPLYYKSFWEMYAGADSAGGEPFAVHPGDLIEASVRYADGLFELKLTDITSGLDISNTEACSDKVVCKRATAEWIVERPGGGKYPLADYGMVEFSDLLLTISGKHVANYEIDMIQSGTTLSTCSPESSGGDFHTEAKAFNCKWLAADSGLLVGKP